MPTSQLIAIPAGQVVMVGGPPTISMMALGMNLGLKGLKGLGKGLKKLGRGAAKVAKKVANTVAEAAANAAKKGAKAGANAAKAGAKAAASAAKKGAKAAAEATKKGVKKAKNAAKDAADKLKKKKKKKSPVDNKKKDGCGDPVDVATGEVFSESEDFKVNGVIPIVWTRHWNSASDYFGPVGVKGNHSYDMSFT